MFWFCGGHGQCSEGNGGTKGAGLDVGSIIGSGGGDPKLEAASAAWLARYLKGDKRVRTGPEFEFRSDDGKYRSAPQYPVAPAKPVRGKASGTLSFSPGVTSGSATFASPVSAGALGVPLQVKKRSHLLGPPKVTIRYSRHGRTRRRANLRPAGEPRPRRGGRQPGNANPGDPRRPPAQGRAPARARDLHRPRRRPLRPPARGRDSRLGGPARRWHPHRVERRGRATGGRPQGPRVPGAAAARPTARSSSGRASRCAATSRAGASFWAAACWGA